MQSNVIPFRQKKPLFCYENIIREAIRRSQIRQMHANSEQELPVIVVWKKDDKRMRFYDLTQGHEGL